MEKLSKKRLELLYNEKKFSVHDISKISGYSENKINYWLKKYNIKKRSISDAVYIKRNPLGDPFLAQTPKTMEQAFLFGMGLGLYWGEGTKSNKVSLRLGNTNSRLIKKFIEFLHGIYSIRKEKLKFGLQVFNDSDPNSALRYWQHELGIPLTQFQKVIISPSRGLGNYKKKNKNGVLTVYYHNRKLRNIICNELENL